MMACQSEQKVTYSTAKAEKTNLSTSVTATGTIEPVTKVEVGTQVSGIISKIYVDYNSYVHKGDIMAELDRTNLSSELVSAESNLASAVSTHNYQNKSIDARMYENCNKLFKSINKYTTSSVQISAAGTSSSPSSIAYFNMYSDGNNGANWVIYRLTDIMLLKAEALTQTMREGSDNETIAYNTPILAQAFSLVNAINKRAVCQATLQDTLVATDYSTKAQMEELVLQERQRELMFEGKRWYDLVRRSQRDGNTQTLVNAALRKVTSGGSLIQNKLTKMDAIYWPYNNDEIKVNKNLVQNPAFSSGEDNNYQKTN